MDEEFYSSISKLIEGTEAHLVSDTSTGVMHDRYKVETPIPQLNCIFGGGIPMGIIIEAYGEPASGKSSTWYQTMGNFQRDYPESVSIIVDTEASVDSQRMPFMGCDPGRTMRIPATSIESGFNQVFAILDKKQQNDKLRDMPVFIIWDTIGIGVTQKQLDTNNPYSDGMLSRAKTLKFELSELLPRIEKQPIIVVLLNQVTTQMNRFGSSLTSGGGWGLKHNAHLRLKYVGGKTDYSGIYAVTKHSHVDMDKSKISPQFNGISLVIDIQRGGVVDSLRSMASYALEPLGYIHQSKGWYNFNRLVELNPEYAESLIPYEPGKSRRWGDLFNLFEENEFFLPLMELTFCKEISEIYTYQAEICKPYMDKLREKINSYIEEKDTDISDEVVSEDTEIDVTDDGSDVPIVEENETETVEITEISEN